ncbi:hypothetical protein SAMN04488057_1133 [Cyclobacterium lianum]|uniref:Uncharacterized protein n=1 Tax=Cyclobacterium lianum TaxID=388280 RepID=A0A1M7Q145_9BACT|nr:hypothetical protein SAMN04488057_1133 [Cyclobacterium lianum]
MKLIANITVYDTCNGEQYNWNIVMDPTLPAPTHGIERDVPVTQWDDYKSCEIPCLPTGRHLTA